MDHSPDLPPDDSNTLDFSQLPQHVQQEIMDAWHYRQTHNRADSRAKAAQTYCGQSEFPVFNDKGEVIALREAYSHNGRERATVPKVDKARQRAKVKAARAAKKRNR